MSDAKKLNLCEETVCGEADRLVSGDRGSSYGHPLDDFAKTAAFWSVILGVRVTEEQVALCMIAVKQSRELNKEKRDNKVDIAGYTKCLDMVINERKRRIEEGWTFDNATARWSMPHLNVRKE